MKNTYIIGSKEFKTERGLMNHVAKMFPNATAELANNQINLSINGIVAGCLKIRFGWAKGWSSVFLVSPELTLI